MLHNSFWANGVPAFQGRYFEDPTGKYREIDVEAQADLKDDDVFLRLSHMVECKYARSKPWVVFTKEGAIAPSAAIAQSIGSKTGRAAMRALAVDETVQALELFAEPTRSGFNGREAFSSGEVDLFYKTMKSVVSASVHGMSRYDGPNELIEKQLGFAAIAFPTIVVDGQLFEAFYDSSAEGLRVQPASSGCVRYVL